MSCIGNDVVDLRHPANAGKNKDSRYLKKILTDVEIGLVRKAVNPDRTLWSLWACKETAYKAISKSYAGLSFLPRLWRVELRQCEGTFTDGEVVIPEVKSVFVRLFSSEDYVHCIGSDNLPDLDKVIWGIESLPTSAPDTNVDPSLFVRKCLSARLADIYQLNFRVMDVRRTQKGNELQPPHLYYENRRTPFDISLSHDGQFVAYAFLINGNDFQWKFSSSPP